MTKITRRTLLIYVYYLLSSIAVILLITAAAHSIKNAGVIDQSFVVLRENPISTIWSTIFLISPPDLPGILVLYLELTLIVTPLFLMAAAHSPTLALAASGFIWTISQIYPELAPHLADHSYFNPLAWQFLFSIGMFVGIRHNSDWLGLQSAQILKWLVVVAWTIIIISLAYRFSFSILSKLDLDIPYIRISDITLLHMKENLSVVRLLHFLSIALLVGTYIASSNAIFKWGGVVAIIRVGSCSLEMFSLSAVLSVALSIIAVVNRPSVLEKLVLDGTGMLLMALIAAALTISRMRRLQANSLIKKIKGAAFSATDS